MKITPSKAHAMKITPYQDHSTPMSTTAAACNIIFLRKAFSNYFDMTGNIPGTLHHLHHTQHTTSPACKCKVLIEYRKQIKKTLQELVDLQVTIAVT